MSDGFPWPILVSTLIGTLTGAFITAALTRSRDQRALAIEIMNKYIDMFDRFARVKATLEDPDQLALLQPRNDVSVVVSWF